MRANINGKYVDISDVNVSDEMFQTETENASDPLTQMIEEMSQATTLAEMRAAAKNFLKIFQRSVKAREFVFFQAE